MATLESPLEALAFEYASFGVFAVVNNVWTWIAVVTAAVSFWRIRVTTIGDGDGHHACVLLEELSGSMSEHDGSSRLGPKSSRTGPVKETVAKTLQSRTDTVKETVDDRVKETVTKTEPLVWDDGGVTKGEKLTMYYEVDVDYDGVRCLDGELITAGGGLGDCGGEWWEKWEIVMRMRNGDDGWYRYVDLTVINGNVVRLWDDSNRTSNGRRCLN